jgi:hypothetical protein
VRGRIRTVKPELFKSTKLWDLQAATGLPVTQAFMGLWCYADREGRFEWKPRELKTDVLPYWDGDFEAVMKALASKLFILRYTVNGEDYGYIRNWKEHQKPNQREPASVLPSPEAHGIVAPQLQPAESRTCMHVQDDATRVQGDATHEHAPVEGNGNGNGRELEGSEPRAPAHVATPDPTPVGKRSDATPDESAPTPRFKFRSDWKPRRSDRDYGRELGLTDTEMRERAEHCRLKLYTHPFSTEDEQFRRELLWLRNDKETRAFREQRKANPHGLDENPGARRRPDDPRPTPVFGRASPG